jgi:hypothetical protein
VRVMAVFNLYPMPGDDDTPRLRPEVHGGNVELFVSKAEVRQTFINRVHRAGTLATHNVFHDGDEWIVEGGMKRFPNVHEGAYVDLYTDFAALLAGQPVRIGFYQLGPRGGAAWRKS